MDTIVLSSCVPSLTHYVHPSVPNVHCLKGVLQPEECIQMIGAAHANGFDPDVPLDVNGNATRPVAWYFYWIIDQGFETRLWSRIASHVPKTFGGKEVYGLNRWFRVYRYIPGEEFPAHLDAAWPPSSIDSETGAYVHDGSPKGRKLMSRLTFLIYLSDSFETGGDTTFFIPSDVEGNLNAYPVTPMQGSVLLFPHGELDEAVLHEGTAVAAYLGATPKYVIRTEIIYDA
ncbi:hypothetical protein LTR17_014326 [Elasticomyces elasticus]|nr:hypothetical protein LTR17_014326 [Elasticomyces elasticus]